MASPAATVAPVKISYNALVANDPSLSSEIQRAFDSSPDALGLLIVSDLPPQFPALRRRLLHLADRFAALSQATREQYARPPTFSYGWSHGKEVHNGKPDRLKGSFYNNPKEDLTPGLHPGDEPTPNVWPKEPEVAGFEGDLSSLRGGPLSRFATRPRPGSHGPMYPQRRSRNFASSWSKSASWSRARAMRLSARPPPKNR